MSPGRSRGESISSIMMAIWILHCAKSGEAFSFVTFSRLPSPYWPPVFDEGDHSVGGKGGYAQGIDQSVASATSRITISQRYCMTSCRSQEISGLWESAHPQRSKKCLIQCTTSRKIPSSLFERKIIRCPKFRLYHSSRGVGNVSTTCIAPKVVSMYIDGNFPNSVQEITESSHDGKSHIISSFFVDKNILESIHGKHDVTTLITNALKYEGNGRIPTENGGFLHSEESRAKISAANKGKTPWNKGKNHSDEVRLRISEGVRARNRQKLRDKAAAMGLTLEEYEEQKKEEKRLREAERRRIRTENGGYKLNDETRRKISQTLKEKWAKGEVKRRDPSTYFRKDPSNGSRKGKKHSDETKDKIRKTLKAKWENDEVYRTKMQLNARAAASKEETRKKISDTLKKKWEDPEFRSEMLKKIKNRKSLVGSKTDDEHRKKISEAMRRKWQDPSYRNAACNGMAKKRSMTSVTTNGQKQRQIKKVEKLTTTSLPSKRKKRVTSGTKNETKNNVKQKPSIGELKEVRLVEPLKANNRVLSKKPKVNIHSKSSRGSKSHSAHSGTSARISKMKENKEKRKELVDTSKIPTRRKASVTVEEERAALMKKSNPDLFDLLYGAESVPEKEETPRSDFVLSALDCEDDDFDLESYDPYGLDNIDKTTTLSQHESILSN